MIALLTGLVGPRFAKPALYAIAVLLLVGIGFGVAKCSSRDDKAQVSQSNRSGEAISNAAEKAIEKIGDRTLTEATIDRAVAETVKEIDRAETADDVRFVVIANLCRMPEHRSDPACQLP